MEHEEIHPVSTETAAHYTWGGVCDGWHLVKSDDLSVIQERMPAGASEARHFHRRAQQFFYILSGEAVMDVDGQRVTLGNGQGLWILPGVPHQMRNDSGAEVHFLVISQPPSHWDREVVPEI